MFIYCMSLNDLSKSSMIFKHENTQPFLCPFCYFPVMSNIVFSILTLRSAQEMPSYSCVCFTCGVLLCYKRLGADRLSTRHPTCDTDQAALQVWRNTANVWMFELQIKTCHEYGITFLPTNLHTRHIPKPLRVLWCDQALDWNKINVYFCKYRLKEIQHKLF